MEDLIYTAHMQFLVCMSSEEAPSTLYPPPSAGVFYSFSGIGAARLAEGSK